MPDISVVSKPHESSSDDGGLKEPVQAEKQRKMEHPSHIDAETAQYLANADAEENIGARDEEMEEDEEVYGPLESPRQMTNPCQQG